MVEGTALEKRHTRKGIESSNLSLSAKEKWCPRGAILFLEQDEIRTRNHFRSKSVDEKPFPEYTFSTHHFR